MMMKKALLIALCAAALALTGCGEKKDVPETANTAPEQTQQAPQTSAVVTVTDAPAAAAAEIDLTGMSSTMVYSYIYNMVTAPDDFIGQRFRIRGVYDEQYWEQTSLTYHYLVSADAPACCAQGLEFVLTDPNAAYPQVGEEFEISGIFGTYEEEGNLYIQIAADNLEKV